MPKFEKNNYTVALKEYVERLSDTDLEYINLRVRRNIGSDQAEIVNVFAKDYVVNKYLQGAITCYEWFRYVDEIVELIRAEMKYRFNKCPYGIKELWR